MLVESWLPAAEAAHLESELAWFARHLKAPRLDQRAYRAQFWFRAQSPLVRRAWDIVWPLQEFGIQVCVRRTRRPGCIVYDDEHQVAAIPHARRRR